MCFQIDLFFLELEHIRTNLVQDEQDFKIFVRLPVFEMLPLSDSEIDDRGKS